MVNLKATIDYNNILIKAQLNYFSTVSANKTNSKRPVYINVSERYYRIAGKFGEFGESSAIRQTKTIQISTYN